MNPDTTVVSGIVCKPCGKELPPMTMTEHLNGGGCPCQKLTRPGASFRQVPVKMPPSPIQIHPQLAADKCLSWYWGRVYAGLMEDPTSKTWYIDDRCSPKEFWILLAIAQPEIWMNRRGKNHIPIGHLTKAIRYMKKDEYRAQIEELMADGAD